MINLSDEEYEYLLEKSRAKRDFHELFIQFSRTSQEFIVNKYPGIFNFYDEVSDQAVYDLCVKLQNALVKRDKFIHDHIEDEL